MSLMNERPSSGAFLRSSVHLAQVGCGSSPGRANSFANAPSKTPLRSTKINHPTDLPASSFFSHSPATVGSAAWMGSAALVNATMLAMNSIEIRVFKGIAPAVRINRHRATICPFQGAPVQRNPLASRTETDSVAIPPWSAKISALTAISPLLRPVRGLMNCTALLAANVPKVVDCTQAQALILMPLIYRLASRNLLHDRLRFIATVIGIVFSVVLVTVQLRLSLGFGRMGTTTLADTSTGHCYSTE